MRSFMSALALAMLATAAVAQTNKPQVAPPTAAPSGDAVVGHYRFKSGLIMSVEKSGDALTVKYQGQPPQPLTASPDGKFSYAQGQAYLTFDLDPKGVAKTLHVYYDDNTLPAARIDAAVAKKAADDLELKVKNQTHDPACITTLKRLIEEVRAGKPDYSKMTLQTARATRMQLPILQQRFQEMGPVKDVQFKSVGPQGAEQFDVTFENGPSQWMIQCLSNGYVGNVGFR